MNENSLRIQELSDKVLVIQGLHLLNQDGLKFWSNVFEEHGFTVIWFTV